MDPKKIISGVVLFVLIVAILTVIYLTLKKLYNPFNTGVLLIDEPVQLAPEMTSCVEVLPDGSDHTYSFWMFVSHWQPTPGKHKYIFYRDLDPHRLNVVVGAEDTDLQIFLTDSDGNKVTRRSHMSYYSGDTKMNFMRSTDNDHTHILHNLPLQTWNHLSIVMYDKTLDLYLNGKLTRTFILAREQDHNPSSLVEMGSPEGDGNIFDGFLSKFRYYPRIVSPQEIYKIYLAGPAVKSNLSEKADQQRINFNLSFDGGPECATAK